MLRVLTFGWEFAPLLSGGLGVACAGLGRALARLGVRLTFVVPRLPEAVEERNLRVLSARAFAPRRETRSVDTLLAPYRTAEEYLRLRSEAGAAPAADGALYGRDLFAEVERYAEAASRIAAEVPHDVIHCHDWMTYEAGIRARSI
ncbi:MAG: glycogen/starch synthase, partial [Candidatus Binatia bacterium]